MEGTCHGTVYGSLGNGERTVDSLIGHKDLESRDDVCKRNAPVVLPLPILLLTLKEDDEIVVLALEVGLELHSLAASHCW